MCCRRQVRRGEQYDGLVHQTDLYTTLALLGGVTQASGPPPPAHAPFVSGGERARCSCAIASSFDARAPWPGNGRSLCRNDASSQKDADQRLVCQPLPPLSSSSVVSVVLMVSLSSSSSSSLSSVVVLLCRRPWLRRARSQPYVTRHTNHQPPTRFLGRADDAHGQPAPTAPPHLAC